MDLGATVCTPRAPVCTFCPLGDVCLGREQGIAEQLPKKTPKKPVVEIKAVAGIWVRDGAVLVCKRPMGGLLGGLWGPPEGEAVVGEPGLKGPAALQQAFRQRLGAEVDVGEDLGEVVHVFTHRRQRTQVFRVDGPGQPEALTFYTQTRWLSDLTEVGLSTLGKKLLRRGGVVV
jgi:A/G-specific adenine glycosylase